MVVGPPRCGTPRIPWIVHNEGDASGHISQSQERPHISRGRWAPKSGRENRKYEKIRTHMSKPRNKSELKKHAKKAVILLSIAVFACNENDGHVHTLVSQPTTNGAHDSSTRIDCIS